MTQAGKVPGASVKDKPLMDMHGDVIGKILKVVFTDDHRQITHGVVELNEPGGKPPKQVNIPWQAVGFNEKGEASLRYEIDEKGSIPGLRKNAADLNMEEAAEVELFAQRMEPK